MPYDKYHFTKQVKDFQRQRVYDAERTRFFPKEVTEYYNLPERPKLMTIKECRAFVDRVVKSKHWTSRTDLYRVVVKDGRGCRNARAGFEREYENYVLLDVYGRIVLPRWARSKEVILHELAHLIAEGDQHGAYFAEQYVALVSRFIGREAAKVLREDFKHFGVQPFGKVNKGDRCSNCQRPSHKKLDKFGCPTCNPEGYGAK